ncbi:MAG: hypothetical protein ACRER5_22700 [Pseudomonas sp.]
MTTTKVGTSKSARKRAARMLAEEASFDPTECTHSWVASTKIMRHPGGYAHTGGEVAAMLAKQDADGNTRNPGMGVAWKDKDCAGPLKEQVGCTVRSLDYIGRLDGRGKDQ